MDGSHDWGGHILDGGNRKGMLINCLTIGLRCVYVDVCPLGEGGTDSFYEVGELGVLLEHDESSLVDRTQRDS